MEINMYSGSNDKSFAWQRKNSTLGIGCLGTRSIYLKRVTGRLQTRFLCGGGVEYLHRSPARRRSLPKGSIKSETVEYGRESHEIRTREWIRWPGPATIVNDRFILSWERMLYKDYDRMRSVEKKKYSSRESQEARRQHELIDGKPPVVK
jgi:hypothetical protein